VREVPCCSRFTHQASSVCGWVSLYQGPVKVRRSHSSDYSGVAGDVGMSSDHARMMTGNLWLDSYRESACAKSAI
jgi:hypothetical protein